MITNNQKKTTITKTTEKGLKQVPIFAINFTPEKNKNVQQQENQKEKLNKTGNTQKNVQTQQKAKISPQKQKAKISPQKQQKESQMVQKNKKQEMYEDQLSRKFFVSSKKIIEQNKTPNYKDNKIRQLTKSPSTTEKSHLRKLSINNSVTPQKDDLQNNSMRREQNQCGGGCSQSREKTTSVSNFNDSQVIAKRNNSITYKNVMYQDIIEKILEEEEKSKCIQDEPVPANIPKKDERNFTEPLFSPTESSLHIKSKLFSPRLVEISIANFITPNDANNLQLMKAKFGLTTDIHNIPQTNNIQEQQQQQQLDRNISQTNNKIQQQQLQKSIQKKLQQDMSLFSSKKSLLRISTDKNKVYANSIEFNKALSNIYGNASIPADLGKKFGLKYYKGIQNKGKSLNHKNSYNSIKLSEISPSQTILKKNQQICEVIEQQQPVKKHPTKLDEYTFGKIIGRGAFAIVKQGIHKPTNTKVALKIYDKIRISHLLRKKNVKREIKLLYKMQHSNIIRLIDYFNTKEFIVIITEYVEGNSLHGYLKNVQNHRLNEIEARHIIKQVILALGYCHHLGITHRDIKLENLIITDDKIVKLIDFGLSTHIPNHKKIKIFCGTPSYMASEIVLKKEHAGPPTDVWAVGVLLFVLVTGTFPFKGTTDKELYKKISKAEYVIPEYLTLELRELIKKILVVAPEKRPSAQELLNDQWFVNYEQEDINYIGQIYEVNQKRKESTSQNEIKIENNPAQKTVEHMQIDLKKQQQQNIPENEKKKVGTDENLNIQDVNTQQTLHNLTLLNMINMGYDKIYILKKLKEGINHIQILYNKIYILNAQNLKEKELKNNILKNEEENDNKYTNQQLHKISIQQQNHGLYV